MGTGDDDEEIGFDEGEDVGDGDRVVFEYADGTRHALVLLAVVEHEGQTYALLTGADGDEEESLLVTRYDEDDDGTARFSPLDDDAVLDALADVVKDLIAVDDDDGPVRAGFSGPVGQA